MSIYASIKINNFLKILFAIIFVLVVFVVVGRQERIEAACVAVEGESGSCPSDYSLREKSGNKVCILNEYVPYIGDLVGVESNGGIRVCHANPSGNRNQVFSDKYKVIYDADKTPVTQVVTNEFFCMDQNYIGFRATGIGQQNSYYSCPSNIVKNDTYWYVAGIPNMRRIQVGEKRFSFADGWIIDKRAGVIGAFLPLCYLEGVTDGVEAEIPTKAVYPPDFYGPNDNRGGAKPMNILPKPGYWCGAVNNNNNCRVVLDGNRFISVGSGKFEDANACNAENGFSVNCVNHGSSINLNIAGVDTTRYCFNGQLLEQNIANLSCNANNLDLDTKLKTACGGILDPDEFAKCTVCECSGLDNVWSGGGCIEATGTGIITRVFQIAVGIMGGLIILRIIQVMVLLANPDPSSDKMSEAREILSSLVIFAIFLGGAILLLRYIGYNIIGINVPIFGG